MKAIDWSMIEVMITVGSILLSLLATFIFRPVRRSVRFLYIASRDGFLEKVNAIFEKEEEKNSPLVKGLKEENRELRKERDRMQKEQFDEIKNLLTVEIIPRLKIVDDYFGWKKEVLSILDQQSNTIRKLEENLNKKVA